MEAKRITSDNDRITREKEVQYYSNLVNAWLSTRLEKDKSLLTLSTGGIGLLVTLLTTVGPSLCVMILYFLAIFCFLICSISVVTIFDRNARHLEEVMNNRADSDIFLKILDKIAYGSFILGIIFSFVIGICTSIENLQKK